MVHSKSVRPLNRARLCKEAKQALLHYPRWEEINLGDLFLHENAAAAILLDGGIGEQIFLVLERAKGSYVSQEDIAERLVSHTKADKFDSLRKVKAFFSAWKKAGGHQLPGLFVEERLATDRASNGKPTGAWKLAPKCNWFAHEPSQLLGQLAKQVLKDGALTPGVVPTEPWSILYSRTLHMHRRPFLLSTMLYAGTRGRIRKERLSGTSALQ
jgi:hypothetical protein